MNKKGEPWYIHAALYLVIAILTYILIRVAIIDPSEYIEKENYFSNESHLRMENIRQAEILWEKKNEKFTDNLEELITYIKTDSAVAELIVGIDTLTNRPTNPFKNLSNGKLDFDSLLVSPASHTPYILKVDTTVSIDTVVNQVGELIKVDTVTTIGSIYYLACPDGYGTIGDTATMALKNTASWD